ncbi:MAG TPA: winged helix-turn-helix domain-containing protein [Candidatus Baltobacteraceae bacterium]|jgi:DNA-binding transcriptional ArsR family regulator|nr:winged helix-turn-helix domain-containing protein [Candidatus Baltobacteraceae bacterium]
MIQIVSNKALLGEAEITGLPGLRAVADSQRHRILTLLIQEPMTAASIAKRLKINRTRVYYHLDLLEKHGMIRVIERRQVGAVMERTYRAVARSFRVNRRLLASTASPAAIAQTEAALIESAAADARAARDPKMWVARAFLHLRPADANKLRAELRALLKKYRTRAASGGKQFEVAAALFAIPGDDL